MNSIKHKRVLPKALAVLALSISAAYFASSAYAMCDAGYTCFQDYDAKPKKWGQVKGTNSNWGRFGWNDKADWFFNNGRTYSNCIYEHANYRGSRVLLKRGWAVEWRNIVSSNRWTKASSCP